MSDTSCAASVAADGTTVVRLLRRKQVEGLTGLRRSTIYEHMARGRFPVPVRIGARSVAWLSSEVEAWIAARIAESRPALTTGAKP